MLSSSAPADSPWKTALTTTYALATVNVTRPPAEPSYKDAFATTRTSPELTAKRAALAPDLEPPPDKTLSLAGLMPGMADHEHPADRNENLPSGIEWEDAMQPMNRMAHPTP